MYLVPAGDAYGALRNPRTLRAHRKLRAARFLREVEHALPAGLPYQEELLDELTALIEGADGASKSANEARVVLQEKQREVRELSATFHKGLVSLRRAVRATLGASHFDYQRLRVSPGRVAAEPHDEPPATT